MNLLLVVDSWLEHDPLRSIVCEPTVVHKCTQPNLHSVRSPELLFAHQAMKSSIPITHYRHVLSKVVLLYPVYLEVAKWLAVPASYDWKGVLGLEAVLDENFLMGNVALFTPEMRHARVVHPLVQVLCVGFKFQVQ